MKFSVAWILYISSSMKNTLVVILLFSTSQVALAKLDIASTQPMTIPMADETSEAITAKDVEKVIPLDLKVSNDLNQVAARIADRSLETWFNSEQVKGSALGQTATKAQKQMATDITIKSDQPHAVEHKFNMQILALQTAARVQYTGFLNAVFNYDARAAQSVVELSEKIFNKDLFINHSSSSKEDVSTVGIKWGW